MNNRIATAVITTLSLLIFSQEASARFSEVEFERCTQLPQDKQRLKCFDAMAEQRTVNIIPDSSEVNKEVSNVSALTVDASTNEVIETADKVAETSLTFGDEHLAKAAEEKLVEQVNFLVKQVDKLSYDNLRIAFTNGQIWQQKDSVVYRLKPGDSVTLSRGFGSAVYLKREGKNKKIRVRRIK